jgi:uncharacterized membrane protein
MRDKVPFRLRSHEISRVEAFSDVVFGFALTLIVVSLEVPKTYEELMHTMRGFLPFAICFAILVWVWHAHYTYFRRYALTDEITVALNTALLFVVLFYIYPMKFLFSVATGTIQGGRGNASTLFLIYGLGFAGIFTLFLLMYIHAWRKRDQLALNEVERHDTKTSMMMYGSYIGIGLLSALIGVLATSALVMNFAGWTYFLIGPVSAVIGARRGRQRKVLEMAMVG